MVGYTLKKAGDGRSKIMTVRPNLWKRIMGSPVPIRTDVIGIWIAYLKRTVGLSIIINHTQQQEWIEANRSLEKYPVNSLDTLRLRAYLIIKDGLIYQASYESLTDLLDLMFVLYPSIFKDLEASE